jgi:RND family efflux transporter MFP subunit
MRPRHVVLLILIVVALAGAAYVAWDRFLGPRHVTVGSVIRGPAVEAVYATGTVESVREAEIAPTIRSRIEAIRCIEGERVSAGDVLVELDDDEARARLADAEAVLAFQKQELDRFRELAERNSATRQTLERTVSLYEQARASVDAARQLLEDMTLTAPFDAVVLRQEHEAGDVLDGGDTVCWIGQDRPFRVSADVDEEDISRVMSGQRVLVKADAFPNDIIEAQVGEVTPRGDTIDKSYRVRMLLPADAPLLVGMTVEVNILVREVENALLVPASAYRDGAVWLVVDGAATYRPVEAGIIGRERIEIVSGLAEGDRVILDPAPDLAEGEAVAASGG